MGFWNILVYAQFVAIYRNSNRKRYSTAAYTTRSEVARVQKCLTIARFLCDSLVLFRQLRYIEALSLVNGDSRRGRRAVHVYVRASAAAHAPPWRVRGRPTVAVPRWGRRGQALQIVARPPNLAVLLTHTVVN